MYQLIACDLDETLLNRQDNKISLENRKAIARAIDNGVRFVVTTGRGYESALGALPELELKDAAEQYVIALNGGAIIENETRNFLHFEGISFEQASKLFAKGLQYNICMHIYTQDDVYVYNMTNDERNVLDGRMVVSEFSDSDLNFLKGQQIAKIVYVHTDHQFLSQIYTELGELSRSMAVSFSSNRYMEFNKQGVSKGSGLKRLAGHLHIDMSNVIAIGDNYNDISMIEAAGLGVGVKNMVEELKQKCDYITEATCDESAVAEVISKFFEFN